MLPLIIVVILLQPPAWLTLSLLAVLPGGVILPNLSGIIFELYWPKLNWDNEQKAVKQNLNVLYGMAVSLLYAALFAVPAIVWQLSLAVTALFIGAGSLLLSLAVFSLLLRILPRRMLAIEP
jgi:ABC-2 type transport system permease protein